ncbi:transcriptional activator xlnR [Sodiomyces alkalinus F11]|uniref:Transcriptional activator xlnR n=1 Tax=Sodiomyces alkalinus (strain CBS 110278 / VKM F-3762 / F11) TaxID=1314773 RepID=A0A3N2Q5V9_SODAK|nr:transcriptional activator xlnR [Sodiomyces alkalinus F11]ROT42169.1 transcriptional activator xlnR [Sodiomyces alkalinus F11]
MLSNPLHRFSPYHTVPSSTLFSNGHVPNNPPHSAGIHEMPQGYPIQHMQPHVGVQHAHMAPRGAPGPSQPKHRHHPYVPGTRTSGASGPVRRRISRACDQCNQLRTKCDGQHPCAHCIEFGLTCEYIRERKKRGKASRKDLAQQQAAAQAAGKSDSDEQGKTSDQAEPANAARTEKNNRQPVPNDSQKILTKEEQGPEDVSEDAMRPEPTSGSLEALGEMNPHPQVHQQHQHLSVSGPPGINREHMENPPSSLDLNGYGNMAGGYDRQGMVPPMMDGTAHAPYAPNQGNMPAYPDLPYAMQPQSPSAFPSNAQFRMNSPLNAYPMAGEPTSPGWMDMPSPTAQYQQQQQQPQPQQQQQRVPHTSYGGQQLRYPVLEPLIPHLGNIIPISLACDLIDLYFASSSSAQMHPMSPYVLGYVFRKRSFLHPTKPRQCQPALLASMLWVSAQTSDAPFLTSVPSARGKICQKLLELTVGLLKPLIHTPTGEGSPAPSPVVDGVALGGLGVALPGSMSMDALSGESGAFGAAGKLDDVITYIHLATVVSASEYKGASIRWWNAAWSLARELKLGRELPPSPASMCNGPDGSSGDPDGPLTTGATTPGVITEEQREERRRIWWLTYIVDRHLALCYNRPLFLLDIECSGLLQPMDDTAWQNGEFNNYSGSAAGAGLGGGNSGETQQQTRLRGPHFECTGHGIFGYFLPLMTILGEIVDLHHARNHPRFGVGFRAAQEFDDQAAEITRHLDAYERSLKRFEQLHLGDKQAANNDQHAAAADGNESGAVDANTPSVHSVHTNTSNRMTESDIQTKIVVAYGTHVMHVLHILLAGKWDPINLIDDNDLWISSQGFITATGHAVSAAEAISNILEFDPGLEFMPFFFGIYLLQGSFLLLLIADKLQLEASPAVVKACETIIRAHEACVVTLNTEYQRNFSKVMRSALAQVRGRVPEDLREQNQRRRELLALYRWTGDGTGLAL